MAVSSCIQVVFAAHQSPLAAIATDEMGTLVGCALRDRLGWAANEVQKFFDVA